MKPWLWIILFATACAGWSRDCSSCTASNFGSDWIVVQLGAPGTVVRCWKLENTAMDNERGTDGIFWQDPAGHLVHISGWYNRVQVVAGLKKREVAFAEAAKSLGVEIERCVGGAYEEKDAP